MAVGFMQQNQLEKKSAFQQRAASQLADCGSPRHRRGGLSGTVSCDEELRGANASGLVRPDVGLVVKRRLCRSVSANLFSVALSFLCQR